VAQKKEPAWVVKGDRISIGIVTVGALLVAAGILISFVVTTVGQVSSGEITFPVITEATVPAGEFGAERGLVAATYTEASVTASGLSPFPFAAFIVAHAVNTLTELLVALALAFMGWRLLKGDPFRKSVVNSALVAASALLLGPFIALLASVTATTRALVEIAGPKDGQSAYIFSAEFNLTPAFIGLALAIVLGAFEYGQKLKADTEGLV
jgi:hypothetical protein